MSQRTATIIVLALFTGFFSFAGARTLLLPTAVEVPRQPGSYSFENVETFSYKAHWNGIPVATAEIQGAPLTINGKALYRVEVQAKTTSILDFIWRMRDTIASTFDAQTIQPHQFVFSQRENSKSTDTTALFDQGKSKWSVQQQRGRKIAKFDFISNNTFDPITAVYMLRNLDFKVGDRIQFEVFGGKSRYWLTLDVVGRESITLNSGSIEAYKIIPQIKNINKQGYAERMRRAVVWVSADERKIPLRAVTSVFIGSIYLEMQTEGVPLKKVAAPELSPQTSVLD
jgi:Protein of unknown function (DUF3108)